MSWILIYILVSGTEVDAVNLGQYETMYECFEGRELHLDRLSAKDGMPPVNTQLVCIRTQ